MRSRLIFLFLCLAFAFQAGAQNSLTADEEKKKKEPRNEQRQIDEQLASRCFADQEYDKAEELYKKLYQQYGQPYQFHQYVECLILQKDYGEAVKQLKSFVKSHPNETKSLVDLVFVYGLDNESRKAEKQFDAILKSMPKDRGVIQSIGNSFRSRGLNDLALQVYERGVEICPDAENSPFYIEMAYTYQSMADYQNAFRYYFLELEEHPGQYNNIKNRLQTMLFYDVNNSIANSMRMALLKQTQEKPDNIEFAKLLVWFALQQEDYDIALVQSKSIDKRIGDQEGQIVNLAGICLNNKQFDVACDGFDYVCKKGKSGPYYGRAVAGLIDAEYQKLKSENRNDTKAFSRLSDRVDEEYRNVSTNEITSLVKIQADIMAFRLGRKDDAIQLLQNTIETVSSKQGKAELKLLLADIYLFGDEVWEATLLYSQVDKSMKEEPLGHEARYRNAQLRYFIGEFAWAETQLHVLKAATSKLIANDAMTLSLIIKDNLEIDTTGVELKRLARADYRIYQQRDDEALLVLDSIIADGNEASIPHALFRKAELTEKRRQFAEAEQLYMRIVDEYEFSYMADNALMKAALLEQNELNKKEQAKQHYETLIDNYPTSLYASQAKKNYRKL